MSSPELETLDQLLGADLRLGVVSKLFASRETFGTGTLGLLSGGNVVLVTSKGAEVPKWQWRELLSGTNPAELLLRITSQGARRIV
jgi:hypothetical protein